MCPLNKFKFGPNQPWVDKIIYTSHQCRGSNFYFLALYFALLDLLPLFYHTSPRYKDCNKGIKFINSQYQGFDRGKSLYQKMWTHLDNREKRGLSLTKNFLVNFCAMFQVLVKVKCISTRWRWVSVQQRLQLNLRMAWQQYTYAFLLLSPHTK